MTAPSSSGYWSGAVAEGLVRGDEDVDVELDAGPRRLRHVEPLDGLLDGGDVFGEVADGDRLELLVEAHGRVSHAAAEREEHVQEVARVAMLDLEHAVVGLPARRPGLWLGRRRGLLLRLRVRGGGREQRGGDGEQDSVFHDGHDSSFHSGHDSS